jgi:dTDP-4-amino-4,6-dideoxygalactose transaminase
MIQPTAQVSRVRAARPLPIRPERIQKRPRIHLSAPHMGTTERGLVSEAFDTNWIAPVGPHVDAFESRFADAVGSGHAAAVSSGTAALHLALRLVGVGPGSEVLVSTLTFAASVTPVLFLGATPSFVDSDYASWNMDPELLTEALETRAREGRLPSAVVVVHLYGQCADMDPILAACARYDVPVVEDAAEALGATYHGRSPGTLGSVGIYSFNGNKIITTSGGGMLVADDASLVAHARKLATQAKEVAAHYEHIELGYNYRMSNILAGIGIGQLAVLEDRVQARRRNFEFYRQALGDLPGLRFMPEADWGRHTRWLTTLTIDPTAFGADREAVRLALEEENIESRPVWKPMHRQPVFSEFPTFGGAVADDIFRDGLCLPSGSSLSRAELERVVETVRRMADSGTMGWHAA